MEFVHQGVYGPKGDPAARAIYLATGRHPEQVATELRDACVEYVKAHDNALAFWIRDFGLPKSLGTPHQVWKPYLRNELGWHWTTTMRIGSGTKVHLREDELPKDMTLIVQVTNGPVTVRNNKVHAYYDPRRNGKRAVYGFFSEKPVLFRVPTATMCPECGMEWYTASNLEWHWRDAHRRET